MAERGSLQIMSFWHGENPSIFQAKGRWVQKKKSEIEFDQILKQIQLFLFKKKNN